MEEQLSSSVAEGAPSETEGQVADVLYSYEARDQGELSVTGVRS